MTLLGINSSEVRWQSPEEEPALQTNVVVVNSDGDVKEETDSEKDDETDPPDADEVVPVDDEPGEVGELDDFNEDDFDDDFDDDFEEEIEDEEFEDEDEFDLGIDIS